MFIIFIFKIVHYIFKAVKLSLDLYLLYAPVKRHIYLQYLSCKNINICKTFLIFKKMRHEYIYIYMSCVNLPVGHVTRRLTLAQVGVNPVLIREKLRKGGGIKAAPKSTGFVKSRFLKFSPGVCVT